MRLHIETCLGIDTPANSLRPDLERWMLDEAFPPHKEGKSGMSNEEDDKARGNNQDLAAVNQLRGTSLRGGILLCPLRRVPSRSR
jgi:hypothetical protein